MHLLALADTVATCNTDFAERFAIDAAKKAIAKENSTGHDDEHNGSSDSLDDCGLRFLLAMKHFSYLLRCLPLVQRSHFQKQGVGTSNIVWAFHSESDEELLNLIPSYAKGQAKWGTLKELGVGWWLRNNSMMRTCVERLAKAAFQAKQDPLDAAIYYIAMKKKSVVWGLFRSKHDDKMTQFFANNFAEDRWRKAALKNAFALLGKQRFDHAVAFFLLANSLNDAIEVCLTKLDDLQLALIIARLYEGGEHDPTPPTFKKLLYEEILGCDKDGLNQDITKAHPDPFYRSMALWTLKDYIGSLNTLLLNNVGQNHSAFQDDDPLLRSDANQSANPNVFNFYIYLRTHPLLIRQQIASHALEKRRAQVVLSGFSYNPDDAPLKSHRTDKQLQLEDSITSLERQLYFTTAHAHFKAGCPALALEVLSKLPSKVIEQEKTSQINSPSDPDDSQLNTGIIDWGQPEKKESIDMDWGAPATATNGNDDFKIQWDDDDDDGGISSGSENGLEMKIDNKKIEEEVKVEVKLPEPETKPTETKGTLIQLDIMAQQLKFVACLKILMEELSTLATGFEVDGGQLRYQLYVWLEREVEALRTLCSYSTGDAEYMEEKINIESNLGERDTPILGGRPSNAEKPTLHEILMQEKQDFEAKVHRAARRKRWLKGKCFF